MRMDPSFPGSAKRFSQFDERQRGALGCFVNYMILDTAIETQTLAHQMLGQRQAQPRIVFNLRPTSSRVQAMSPLGSNATADSCGSAGFTNAGSPNIPP